LQDISDYIGNLTVLNLSRNKIDNNELRSLTTNLSNNSTLSELDLSFNEIDGEGLVSLSEALQNNSSLQYLNLSGNNFSNGIHNLCNAQTKNSTLLKLSLSSTKLNQAIKNVSEALKNLFPGLVELDLSRNFLGNEEIKEITEALSTCFFIRKSASLKKLILKENKINQSVAKEIMGFLKSNPSITELDLSDNTFKIKMLKKIEDILEKNRKVKRENFKIQVGLSTKRNNPNSGSSPLTTNRSSEQTPPSLSGSRNLVL